MTPEGIDPTAWHEYIRSAPNSAASSDRMEEAVAAGVDFAAMLAVSV